MCFFFVVFWVGAFDDNVEFVMGYVCKAPTFQKRMMQARLAMQMAVVA